jgi:hypothetical protein
MFFIQTSKDDVFGGAMSCLIDFTDNKYIKPSSSIVFSIIPVIEVYTIGLEVENVFFASGECLMFGGGKDGPVIYLDKDLKHGFSASGNCFNAPSLVADNKYGEFILKKMEIYLLK